MDDHTPLKGLLRGLWTLVAVAAVAGSLEGSFHAWTSEIPFSVVEFVALAVICVVTLACVGALVGVVTGLIHFVLPDAEPEQTVPLQVGAGTGLIAGFYLWQGAFAILTEGRSWIGAMMAVVPAIFAITAFFFSQAGVRQDEWGFGRRLAMGPVAMGLVALLLVGNSVLWGLRDQWRYPPTEVTRSVVWVTVEGLRRDGPALGARTPRLDAMAAQGAYFGEVVTPQPDRRPALVSLFSGLHPLRHGVLHESEVFPADQRTIVDVLGRNGLVTAGFPSDIHVGKGSGVDPGFKVFDDDYVPGPVPWGRARVFALGLRLLRQAGVDLGERRDDAATAGRAAEWLAHRAPQRPVFAWVHLRGPALAAEGGDKGAYVAALEALDAQVGAIVDGVATGGRADSTLIVVVGIFGTHLGEHGYKGEHFGLYDEVVAVPMWISAPGTAVPGTRVTAQVRLMDLFPTALAWARLDVVDTEGVELIGYTTGKRKATLWCAIIGHIGPDIDQSVLFGLRNNGSKYIRDLIGGRDELYYLPDDPVEAVDLTKTQPQMLAQIREMLVPEFVSLEKRLFPDGLKAPP